MSLNYLNDISFSFEHHIKIRNVILIFQTLLVKFYLINRLRKSRHANLCSKNQFFRENAVIIGNKQFGKSV